MNENQNEILHSTIGTLLIAALLTAASGTLVGCASEGIFTNTETWEPLFNRRNLTGWSVKCKPADRDKQFWKVVDATIVADSMGNKEHDYVWLVTDREYSDFALRLRFRAFRNSPGNSGVQIRSRYDEQAGWLDGPQIDINPPGPWRTGMIWDETRGVNRWLYPDVSKGKWVNESMANPNFIFYYSDEGPGYNDLEITAIGEEITVVLNGITVTKYNGESVLNDQVHKAHNVGQTGHIALQIHKKDQLKASFEDIYIKDLSK